MPTNRVDRLLLHYSEGQQINAKDAEAKKVFEAIHKWQGKTISRAKIIGKIRKKWPAITKPAAYRMLADSELLYGHLETPEIAAVKVARVRQFEYLYSLNLKKFKKTGKTDYSEQCKAILDKISRIDGAYQKIDTSINYDLWQPVQLIMQPFPETVDVDHEVVKDKKA